MSRQHGTPGQTSLPSRQLGSSLRLVGARFRAFANARAWPMHRQACFHPAGPVLSSRCLLTPAPRPNPEARPLPPQPCTPLPPAAGMWEGVSTSLCGLLGRPVCPSCPVHPALHSLPKWDRARCSWGAPFTSCPSLSWQVAAPALRRTWLASSPELAREAAGPNDSRG